MGSEPVRSDLKVHLGDEGRVGVKGRETSAVEAYGFFIVIHIIYDYLS